MLNIIAGGLARMILGLPGAFVKWCFTGFKKPFREIYYESEGGNFLLGSLVIGGIVFIVRVLFYGVDSIIYKSSNDRTKNLMEEGRQEFKKVDTLNLEDSTELYNANRKPVNDTKRLELDSLLKK